MELKFTRGYIKKYFFLYLVNIMKQLYIIAGLVLSVLLIGCVYTEPLQKNSRIGHELKVDSYNKHSFPVVYTLYVDEESFATFVMPGKSSNLKVFYLPEKSREISIKVEDVEGKKLDISTYKIPYHYFLFVGIYYEEGRVGIYEITEF